MSKGSPPTPLDLYIIKFRDSRKIKFNRFPLLQLKIISSIDLGAHVDVNELCEVIYSCNLMRHFEERLKFDESFFPIVDALEYYNDAEQDEMDLEHLIRLTHIELSDDLKVVRSARGFGDFNNGLFYLIQLLMAAHQMMFDSAFYNQTTKCPL